MSDTSTIQSTVFKELKEKFAAIDIEDLQSPVLMRALERVRCENRGDLPAAHYTHHSSHSSHGTFW